MNKMSDEYDRNIEICKIHHKRKEYGMLKNDKNRHKSKRFRKILTIGSILSIVILSIIIAAAVTETGTSIFGATLNIQPDKVLNNNVWGAPYSERQSGSLSSYIYYKSDGSFGWEWHRNNPIQKNGLILPIYPMATIYVNSLPIKLRDIKSLYGDLNYKYTISPTGDYNLAYDLWLNSGDTKKAEIMIWTSCVNQCKPGTYAGEVNDGYNTYKVYYRSMSWLYYAFILKNQTPIQSNYTVNMKVLLDSISNKLNSDWTLSRIDLGNEVWKGSGRIEISKWNVAINNAITVTSSPTPTPTVSPTPTPTVSPTPTPTPTVSPTPTPTPTVSPTPTPTVSPTPTPTVSPTTGITVTFPNGGENLARGTINTVKWNSNGNSGGYVKIELLKGGIVNKVISSYASNDGSHSWVIPFTQTIGSDYRVRVTSTSNSAYNDESDSSFVIS